MIKTIMFHHEGFFWRCWFDGKIDENPSWKYFVKIVFYSLKCLFDILLSPFPVYRGFWSIFMLLGVVTVVVASFFVICAAPFGSHILYKIGGGFFIAAGILFSLVVVLYVIWVQAVADLKNYEAQKKIDCLSYSIYVRYGWSFILAPVGIFFAMFSGMLFLLVGRTIYLHSD
uniref:Transmembrane protein 182 n=1 Tax=Naja naja TaxID=35670 RepID=A0A8C6XEL4_NAJNA